MEIAIGIMKKSKHKLLYVVFVFTVIILIYSISGMLFRGLGGFLVLDERPSHSDAIIVLLSGIEYYPRLIEAASLYRNGSAEFVIINGNRKDDVLRGLEKDGFEPCCPWYEDALRVLSLLGVPRDNVIYISAEDAYETVTEAETVGGNLIRMGYKKIILVTSKYHTRRAHYVWSEMYKGRLSVCSVSAKADPYDPGGWWKDGRQIRWLMAEYGAWIYYYWNKITDI
jgi:uncharacterized SAM-binding protein YcdF (DUF218 family)